MKKAINKRALRFGSEAIIITVLTIAAVVILNIAFTSLCYRFGWYGDMSANLEYKISEECEEYLNFAVIPNLEDGEKITILFCDDEEVVSGDDTQKYAYNSAIELKEMFDGKIEVDFLNVWEHPKKARELGVTSSYDVVVIYKDNHYAISQTSLFMTDSVTQSVVAYHGEKRLAAAMSRVTASDAPMCYITVNHGEAMDSYELLYTLADAGYSCNFLDLLNYDIPADCELLVTVDPQQDLTDKSTSDVSEVQKIKDYLDLGKNYMVFMSPDSFASGGFANLEALLEEWGVDFAHSKGEDGAEIYYQIKDSSHSTSVDGYTIFGQNNQDIFGADANSPIFENTTAINIASGYEKSGDSYKATFDGREREFIPLVTSHSTAEAYAGGKVVKKATDEPFTLMSMTKQSYNGKTSRVFVCASVAFASEKYMQSAVYGNNEVISSIARETGRDNAPYMLKAKPFPTTVMQSVTTKTATVVTVCLASSFALAAAICGAVILIKRKNAI